MEQEIYMQTANKKKCSCAKCLYGQFGGFDNWKCIKYSKGKLREILYENEPCPKFKPSSNEKELSKEFKQLLDEKYGETYDVYSIAKYKGKLYANLIPKKAKIDEIMNDLPAFVCDNNEIKSVPSVLDGVVPFLEGEIIYKHPTKFVEFELKDDDEDASTLVHDKVNKLLSSYANDENAIDEFLKDIGF